MMRMSPGPRRSPAPQGDYLIINLSDSLPRLKATTGMDGLPENLLALATEDTDDPQGARPRLRVTVDTEVPPEVLLHHKVTTASGSLAWPPQPHKATTPTTGMDSLLDDHQLLRAMSMVNRVSTRRATISTELTRRLLINSTRPSPLGR